MFRVWNKRTQSAADHHVLSASCSLLSTTLPFHSILKFQIFKNAHCLLYPIQMTAFRAHSSTKLPPQQCIQSRSWTSGLRKSSLLRKPPRQSWVWSVSDFIFLASALWEWVASPLHRRLLFPPTVYGRCTHHSRIGYGSGWSRNLDTESALTEILTSNLIGSPAR